MAKPTYYFGIHACMAVIEKRPEDILQLFVLHSREDSRINSLIAQAESFGVSIQPAKKATLEKLVNSHQHQGVVLQCRAVEILNESHIEELLIVPASESTNIETSLVNKIPPLFLALDQITDPHNLGACMRSAAAMGVTAVISSKRHSCSLTPTAVKIAAGAAETVPFISVGSLSNVLAKMQSMGVLVVGTMLDEKAVSLYECDFHRASVIVMGSEDIGLRPTTQKSCDVLSYLPMYGDIQSLNVSVATGMALYEARRQIGAR